MWPTCEETPPPSLVALATHPRMTPAPADQAGRKHRPPPPVVTRPHPPGVWSGMCGPFCYINVPAPLRAI